MDHIPRRQLSVADKGENIIHRRKRMLLQDGVKFIGLDHLVEFQMIPLEFFFENISPESDALFTLLSLDPLFYL